MFAIETKLGLVSGFSARHECVQMTDDKMFVKLFKTAKKAQTFIDTYSDAGYGLSSDNADVIKLGREA